MKKPTGKEFIAKNRIIIGVVFLVFAIAFGVLILPKVLNTQEVYNVLAVTRNVEAGDTVTVDKITVVQTTDPNLAAMAYSKAGDVVNAEFTCDVYRGQYVLKTYIDKNPSSSPGASGNPSGSDATTPEIPYTDKVPSGKQIMSVPIPSLSASVSYQLKKGDIIRFYSTYTKGDMAGQAYTPKELQYVEIYGVYDSAGLVCSSTTGKPASIALIVTQAQAEKVVELTNINKTYFSLMSSGDDARASAFLEYQRQVLNAASVVVNENQENQ